MAEDSAFIYELIVIEDLKEVIANWHDICRKAHIKWIIEHLQPTQTLDHVDIFGVTLKSCNTGCSNVESLSKVLLLMLVVPLISNLQPSTMWI